jgi:hypothetical protein
MLVSARHAANRIRTVSTTIQHFWGEIFGCPAESVRCIVVLHVQLAQSEIAQCDVASVVKQDVLGFKVTFNQSATKPARNVQLYKPIDNIQLMQVFQCKEQLCRVKSTALLVEALLLL